LNIFDQSKNNDLTAYGEAVRLSNELRYKPSGTRINSLGESYFDNGRLWGFDVETAEYGKLLSYFTDARIKKRSQSLIVFILRVISIRFPNEYQNDKLKINKIVGKSERELIQSETKDEVEWLGEVGFQNRVRLDKSLNIKNVKSIKTKHGWFESRL